MKIKTGIGIDAHRFVEGRPLIIGGINIPFEKGLDGHSDADVLIHAIIDSLAGVCLGKDIGHLFPDTDEEFKGIDSKILLSRVIHAIRNSGYSINNIDCELVGEKPKFNPFIDKMRETLAQVIKIDVQDITIKATTTEKMGFTGREEGLLAVAVSTVVSLSQEEIHTPGFHNP